MVMECSSLSRHAPRKRGIQYAGKSAIEPKGRGILGRPVKPGDDTECVVVNCFVISRRVLLVRGLVHQAVEFAFVGKLDLEEPGLAGGVGIDERGLGSERLVDFRYFARNRRGDIGSRLDRFDHRGGSGLFQAAATFGSSTNTTSPSCDCA